MKKNVFFCLLTAVLMIAATGMLSSCDNVKKSGEKVGDCELFEQDGLQGLKDSTGQVVLAPKYAKIEEVAAYKAIFATTEPDGATTILIGGYPAVEDVVIDSIVPTNLPEYVYIHSQKTGVYLWKTGTSSVIGPFTDIKLIDDIVFLNADGLWGAATLQHQGLAPRKFDKLYIVKNGSTLAVVAYDKNGYAMYDKEGVSDGVRYDTSSKELERELKKLDVTGDIAVIKVTWPL